QPRRYAHARRAGVERDEEVMLARQPVLGCVREDALHHAAQGLLGQEVVADMVGRHDGRLGGGARVAPNGSAPDGEFQSAVLGVVSPAREMAVEASVARCLRTPPDAAKTSGLQDRSFKPHYAAQATGAKLSLATIAVAR